MMERHHGAALLDDDADLEAGGPSPDGDLRNRNLVEEDDPAVPLLIEDQLGRWPKHAFGATRLLTRLRLGPQTPAFDLVCRSCQLVDGMDCASRTSKRHQGQDE